MSTITRIALLITVFFTPAVIAEENPHCISSTDGYGVTTTQCDNGYVTVTDGSQGKVIVCNSSSYCQEFKL